MNYRLVSDKVRANAVEAVRNAPDGYVVSIGPEKRNLDQNAKLWSILNQIADVVTYNGLKLSAEDFKILFLDALHRETRFGAEHRLEWLRGARALQLQPDESGICGPDHNCRRVG